MIIYTTANTENDLHGILQLQKENLTINLHADEIKKEGFVTVHHSFDDLERLNNIEKHIVAKEGDSVIAYLLAMTARSKDDIPVLIPMFNQFDQLSFRGKFIADFNYIVVGQVCVAKQFRGQGILDAAYSRYKDQFENKYDFAITEIASTNQRSINAHKRIGFKEIHKYNTPDKIEWVIVLWQWNK